MSKVDILARQAEVFGQVAKEHGKRAMLGGLATAGYVYTGVKGVGFMPREADMLIAGTAGLRATYDALFTGVFTLAKMATHGEIAEAQQKEAENMPSPTEQLSDQ